ncbi:MAG TPA: ABC transporter substrate-binding protein [Chloroflexota bacterium]|nr:ABC transporter substrate-binding protein [Chloroflexota bacterium]
MRRALLSGFLGLVLAACGGAPAAGGSASAGPSTGGKPERDHVVAMTGTTSGSSAAMWIAGEEGLFQKHGLNVDVRYAESTVTTAALVSGEAQFAQGDGPSALAANVSGVPMKIVAVLNKHNSYSIVTRPDIKTPAALKGKVIAIAKSGDTSDISAHIALKPYGLQVGTDVGELSVGNSAPRLAALLSGQVAGAVLSEAFVDQAVANGMHVLISLEQAQIPYMATAVEVIDSFAKANPNTVIAYLEGLIEGERFFSDPANKPESMAILAKYLKAKPTDPAVEGNYTFYHDRLVHDITPEKAGADTALDALKAIDPARYANVSSDVIIDGSFMEEITKSGFQKKVWGE